MLSVLNTYENYFTKFFVLSEMNISKACYSPPVSQIPSHPSSMPSLLTRSGAVQSWQVPAFPSECNPFEHLVTRLTFKDHSSLKDTARLAFLTLFPSTKLKVIFWASTCWGFTFLYVYFLYNLRWEQIWGLSVQQKQEVPFHGSTLPLLCFCLILLTWILNVESG